MPTDTRTAVKTPAEYLVLARRVAATAGPDSAAAAALCCYDDLRGQGFDVHIIKNNTPLSYRTNRIIGGVAPSEYVAKPEKGNSLTPAIDNVRLDTYLKSHLIEPLFFRTNGFDAFMIDQQKQLLVLIEQATGKAAYTGSVREEGEDAEADEDTIEAKPTIPAI